MRDARIYIVYRSLHCINIYAFFRRFFNEDTQRPSMGGICMYSTCMFSTLRIPKYREQCGGATGRGQGDHGKGQQACDHVRGAWGVSYLLCLRLHTCYVSCARAPSYPTPVLSPSPPGICCLPTHATSHARAAWRVIDTPGLTPGRAAGARMYLARSHCNQMG